MTDIFRQSVIGSEGLGIDCSGNGNKSKLPGSPRWCLNRDYAFGAEGHAVRTDFAITTPITSFSFVDDELMSARNTTSLHDFYENPPRAMKRISPQDVGGKRIEHFGFFNVRFEGGHICCPNYLERHT